MASMAPCTVIEAPAEQGAQPELAAAVMGPSPSPPSAHRVRCAQAPAREPLSHKQQLAGHAQPPVPGAGSGGNRSQATSSCGGDDAYTDACETLSEASLSSSFSNSYGSAASAGPAQASSALERVLAQLSKALDAAARSRAEAEEARSLQREAEARTEELELRLSAAAAARDGVWRGALAAATATREEAEAEYAEERSKLAAEAARLRQRLRVEEQMHSKWRTETRRGTERLRAESKRAALWEYALPAASAGLAVGAAAMAAAILATAPRRR